VAYGVSHLACVKVLHEKEAKINVEATLGETLLHPSIKSDIILLVEYLLQFGARPDIMDNKRTNIATCRRSKQIVKKSLRSLYSRE
jgi:ankyrin repeat protein